MMENSQVCGTSHSGLSARVAGSTAVPPGPQLHKCDLFAICSLEVGVKQEDVRSLEARVTESQNSEVAVVTTRQNHQQPALAANTRSLSKKGASQKRNTFSTFAKVSQ